MTDEEVEKIIKANMNLQINLAGIRQDFEEKTKREWVGLTDEQIYSMIADITDVRNPYLEFAKAIEAKLKEKNT